VSFFSSLMALPFPVFFFKLLRMPPLMVGEIVSCHGLHSPFVMSSGWSSPRHKGGVFRFSVPPPRIFLLFFLQFSSSSRELGLPPKEEMTLFCALEIPYLFLCVSLFSPRASLPGSAPGWKISPIVRNPPLQD